MAARVLHETCVGEDAGARNIMFFRVRWLQSAMKGSSFVTGVQAVRFDVFPQQRVQTESFLR